MMPVSVKPSTSLLLYLHADQVVRPANALTGFRVPGIETRVHLHDLAAAMFAAVFWRLREDGLITLETIKKKVLFVIPSTAVRITMLATAARTGLEGEILALLGAMNEPIDVRGVVRAWFGRDVSNPYRLVCGQMESEAIQAGCVAEVAAQRGLVAGMVTGQTTLDPVPERIADFDEPAREALTRWQHAQTEEPLLFKHLLSVCKNAIASRTTNDSSGSDGFSSAADSLGSLLD